VQFTARRRSAGATDLIGKAFTPMIKNARAIVEVYARPKGPVDGQEGYDLLLSKHTGPAGPGTGPGLVKRGGGTHASQGKHYLAQYG
jgi:hypothetical protein